MTQIHWLNPVSGDFNTAADWSGGVVPGASDDAILDAAGSPFTVTVSTSGTVNGIDLAANATLLIDASFTATQGTDGGVNAGSILVGAPGRFVVGGMLTNTGLIELIGAHARNATEVIKGPVTLDGGGTLSLTGASTIKGGSKKAVLTNVDNTIAGAGSLGIPSSTPRLAVINEAGGVIDANVSGHALSMYSDRPSTNTGLMEATGGGVLSIVNTTVDNAGGMIEATGGGSVSIANFATIAGGGLSAGANSTVNVLNATVTDAALSVGSGGEVIIFNFATVAISGVITNAGVIKLGGGSASGEGHVVVDSATSLTGGGTVGFFDPNSTIYGTSPADVLTNVDNTIVGAGAIGGGNLTLVNEAAGVIDASNDISGISLTIDTGTKTITNAGLIESTDGAESVIASPIHNTGTLEAAGGTLTVDGAVTGKAGTAVIDGGTLDFASTFNENVSFTGTSGELELALSQSYSGRIKDFSKTGGTSLDLGDIGFVSASEATYSGDSKSGVLTVTDGTHTATINLKGAYLNATFTASSDGHGGTIVVASTPAAAHRFVAAAAAFGAGEGAASAWTETHPEGPRPSLSVRRLHFA